MKQHLAAWYRSLVAALALLGAVEAFAQAHQEAPVMAPVLAGQWDSAGPEETGRMFATRSFNFDGDRWRVRFRTFADAEMRQALFTLEVGGVFALGGPSAKVPGAWEGVFPAQYRRIMADSDAGVALFASMGCTLRPGQAVSLTAQGCGFVPSLMQAMGEYDLVSVKEGQLFFGDRAGDLAKARPDKLTAFPLRKR